MCGERLDLLRALFHCGARPAENLLRLAACASDAPGEHVFIDDVVEAIARLLPLAPNTAPAVGAGGGDGAAAAVVHRLYNVGNHSPVALQHFIAVIEAALGRKADLRLLPMQPGDVPITYADVARLAAAVDFAPRTPLAEGMAHFVAWYRQFYNI